MQKSYSSPSYFFTYFLVGMLSLSGIFFTYAGAQEDQTPTPEGVTVETTVVSEVLMFVEENGSQESSVSDTTDTNEGTVGTQTFTRMSQEPQGDTCSDGGQTPLPVTIVLTKISCTNESDLPNWGLGGPGITANTASDFLASHPSCTTLKHWGFEWGNQNVTNPGDDFLWEAGSSLGWTSLGHTSVQGVLTAQVNVPSGVSEIRVREVLEPGYLPFSHGVNNGTNANDVSAEMYCANDVVNYDNFDFIRNPVAGQTYHCVAWNVRESVINNAPIITLVGETPMTLVVGGTFTDPGATATDTEDGVLVPVVTGMVNTSVIGMYTISYTATDSQGLSASVTRTVNVVPVGPTPACADGIDNDIPADGATDFPADLGCTSVTDNDENNAPVITLVGETPMTLIVGTLFTDLGATATDAEDGVLVPVATGTVNTVIVGTYTITYVATDSQGLSATTTRTVNVVPQGTTFACSDGIDNDIPADGAIDFPADAGCTSATDNDENNAPVITLIGEGVMNIVIGNTYTDLGATATDTEDGNITTSIVATGTVNTSTLGTYTISYTVSDSQGLSATEVTRTVNVVPVPVTPPPPSGGGGGGSTPPKCANGSDDDADGKADYPADPGCTDSLDNDETDTTTTTGGGGAGTPGLQIFNEKLTVVTPTSVTITWNTNLLADSRVVYGDLSQNPAGVAPQYGYENTTATSSTATSSHTMTVTGLPENSVAFFRPISSNGASTVVGVELVTPLVAGSCTYLEKYLRLGYANDPIEVTKLQRFLKEYEGFTNLAVTGIFDIETDKAVRAFQDKYRADVLTPWNLPSNTGYVYFTTQKKVNEIYCQRAFPLNSAQLIEISDFAFMLQNTGAGVTTGTGVTRPIVTVTPNPTSPITSPVVDLSKIDLSELAPKAPVVALVPEKNTGEIASGVSTDIAQVEDRNKNVLSLRSLLASLSMDSEKKDATTTEVTLETGTATAEVKGTSTPLMAKVAGALGIGVGAFWVWLVLFAMVIVLGYTTGRKSKQRA